MPPESYDWIDSASIEITYKKSFKENIDKHSTTEFFEHNDHQDSLHCNINKRNGSSKGHDIIISKSLLICLFAVTIVLSFGLGCICQNTTRNVFHRFVVKSPYKKRDQYKMGDMAVFRTSRVKEVPQEQCDLMIGPAGNHSRISPVTGTAVVMDGNSSFLDSTTKRNEIDPNEKSCGANPLKQRNSYDLSSSEVYYEALVHPGMFLHPHPSRVLIHFKEEKETRDVRNSILKQILKHNTVEYIAATETKNNQQTVEKVVPSFVQDCDDLNLNNDESSSFLREEECEVEFYRDTQAMFESGVGCSPTETGKAFDIIIVHPEQQKTHDSEFNKILESAYDILSEKGVLIVSLGDSPHNYDSNANNVRYHYAESLIHKILNKDYKSVHLYEESHVNSKPPQSILIACKSNACKAQWFANEADVNSKIHYRILPQSKQQEQFLPLFTFDGTTMRSYQRPPKSWETFFCRATSPTPSLRPAECNNMRGFDPTRPNAYSPDFEIKMSSLGEGVGRGVFTKADIPKGSYIMQEFPSVQFPPLTTDVIEETLKNLKARKPKKELSKVVAYMDGYGYESVQLGEIGHFVDSGISTFTNHGCNGSYTNFPMQYNHLISEPYYLSETAADPNTPLFEDLQSQAHLIFNPVVDRHLEQLYTKSQYTLRDVKKGEEMFENYLFFTEDKEEWNETVRGLRAQCSGEEIGLVVVVDHSMNGKL